MIRRVIQIDESKCNGCGICANACHEGAIAIIDGKAKLTRDDYCDGLGDCLPECPTGAITFVEREAAAYNEQAVAEHKEERNKTMQYQQQAERHGCPGAASKVVEHVEASDVENEPAQASAVSQLSNWPVQIKLAPTQAPYFNGANLLIAADCTAYAYASFHSDFIKNHVMLIGCPKLDGVDYTEKLTQILTSNDIKSLSIVRMEVPCCGGLEHAATEALKASGKFIPWQVKTVSIEGDLLD